MRRAWDVLHTHTSQARGVQTAWNVQQTPSRLLITRQSVAVSVKLGGREPTLIALSAYLANIKIFLVLERALIVHLEKFQQYTWQSAMYIVHQATIRRRTEQSVCCVGRAHSLRSGVATLQTVHVMLDGPEATAAAWVAWLGSINQTMGPTRARVVPLGKYRPHTPQPRV